MKILLWHILSMLEAESYEGLLKTTTSVLQEPWTTFPTSWTTTVDKKKGSYQHWCGYCHDRLRGLKIYDYF